MSLAFVAPPRTPPTPIPQAMRAPIARDAGQRTMVASADLYVMLEHEFRRRKPACPFCFVQLPYRVDVHGRECNWEMHMPVDCGTGCGALLARLVEDFQDLYALSGD